MRNIHIALLAGLISLGLTGCSGTKETLGLTKHAPDEFAVIKRAPLTLPPNYTLRPPQPGAPRPQEQETASQARQTVFGETNEPQPRPERTSAEEIFLEHAGASEARSDIRTVVNKETDNWTDENKPVAQKLLGLAGAGSDEPPATLIDPKKEAQRLRENAETGKPANEGETPTVEK